MCHHLNQSYVALREQTGPTMMVAAPKELWDMGTILTKIRSQDFEQQVKAALHLKAHATKEARIRTSQV